MNLAIFLVAAVVVLVVVLGSRRPGSPLRFVGLLIAAALSLASGALGLLLFKVGMDNNWSSDGPGMLGVMLGILFFGFLSLLFGRLFFGLMDVRPAPEPARAVPGTPQERFRWPPRDRRPPRP